MKLVKLAALWVPVALCGCAASSGPRIQSDLRVQTLKITPIDNNEAAMMPTAATTPLAPALEFPSLADPRRYMDDDAAPRWYMLGSRPPN